MTKKKVTLSIDSNIYDRYKKHCEENAIMLSKKIELFMKKELDENPKQRFGSLSNKFDKNEG